MPLINGATVVVIDKAILIPPTDYSALVNSHQMMIIAGDFRSRRGACLRNQGKL